MTDMTGESGMTAQGGVPAAGVTVTGGMRPRFKTILTPEALDFLAALERKFGPRRRALLAERQARQARLDAGERPGFREDTRHIREADWKVAELPADLRDRRVEITGPANRKMIINAMNSGARCFMADLEDSSCPTWDNVIRAQVNLYDVVRRQISFEDPDSSKGYYLNDETATLIVRPRGWHLEERHILVDGQPCSGAITDFALHFFHNAREALRRGSGPYYYLPKLEGHLEARLWNDIFVDAQNMLDIPQGSIRATVLVETILAAFEMDEILYELREHSAGMNCGRWDYIFSIIKKFRQDPAFVMPDRATVTMTVPNMRAYSLLAIRTCHRRGAPCIGGMAAQIPVKGDAIANRDAFDKVLADKMREAGDGHDGSWVAHPGLVPVALQAFDKLMPEPNQIHRLRDDVTVTAAELLAVPQGRVTRDGVRHNIAVGLRYLEAWLSGNGCVPLFNLMEDAATAEISRAQLWQWRHHQVLLDTGEHVTADVLSRMLEEELAALRAARQGDLSGTRFEAAAALFGEMITDPGFPEFLTLPAYDILVAEGK